MTTAEDFIQRAKSQGYSDSAIRKFLMQSKGMGKKERQALSLLERNPDPDAETEGLISQQPRQSITADQGHQEGMGSTAGSLARRGLATAAGLGTAYALGGPIAAGMQGISDIAGAAGEEEPEGEDAPDEKGIAQVLFNLARKGFKVPTMREAVTLYNTYRRRGMGHTMAQFASNLMRNLSKEEPEEGKGLEQPLEGQEPQAPTEREIDLPQEIKEEANNQYQNNPDITSAAAITASQLLSPGHRYRNLARTIEKNAGTPLEQVIANYLSSEVGTQPEQLQSQPVQEQGMDLSSLSDQELDALMRQRGLL